MSAILSLPTDLLKRYRYAFSAKLFAGCWRYDYSLVGAKGGMNLHITGPHNSGGSDHWTAGLETHSRTPMHGDEAPSHDECWLLKCPCWHDGTSSYAEETYLPMHMAGRHGAVFHQMVRDADERWAKRCDEVAP